MGKRILLADDSVTIQKVVELTFMDEDYEVIAVGNGDEAVARLAEVQPELVIADVHMPGANGFEVCRRVKQWRGATPVLLLVGTFEPFQEGEATQAGADGYLKKPFDSQELLRRVEELLARAPKLTTIPAEEMEIWRAPELPAEPLGAGELFGGHVAAEEPSGPLGQAVPHDMVLEASPWTEAEESTSAPEPPQPSWTIAAPVLSPPAPPAAGSDLRPQAAAPAPAPAPSAAVPSTPPAATNGDLSEHDVDRIARRVVELLGERLVREVAWEVVPDMAELVIKDRLRELERQLEGT